jgi:hypothetical protein
LDRIRDYEERLNVVDDGDERVSGSPNEARPSPRRVRRASTPTNQGLETRQDPGASNEEARGRTASPFSMPNPGYQGAKDVPGPYEDMSTSPGKYLYSHRSFGTPSLISSIATDRASGPAFETQFRSLLDARPGYAKERRILVQDRAPSDELEMRDSEDPAQWQSSSRLTEQASDVVIPSEAQSRRLMDLFLFYLGINQHFFDPRTFSDSMQLLFRNSKSRHHHMQTFWFSQYLLVMAMAKLMDSERPAFDRPPGVEFFAEAVQRLPQIHRLGDYGVMGVENLALTALYLQWLDRKHDAYLYVSIQCQNAQFETVADNSNQIGIALRLAIALGCHIPENEQMCLPSEAAHRIRLYWTVYMLDRSVTTHQTGLSIAHA